MLLQSTSKGAFSVIRALVAVAAALTTAFLLLFFVQGDGIDELKRAQAKYDATQIAAAISRYGSKYRTSPISEPTDVTVSDGAAQSHIMDILSPIDAHSLAGENPKGIVFFEIPNAKNGRNGRVNGTGPYLDPWGNAYFIRMDGNKDGKVLDPTDSTGKTTLSKTVIVWTQGDPKRNPSNDPKKWVKSWE